MLKLINTIDLDLLNFGHHHESRCFVALLVEPWSDWKNELKRQGCGSLHHEPTTFCFLVRMPGSEP